MVVVAAAAGVWWWWSFRVNKEPRLVYFFMDGPLRIATVFLENFREHHRKPPQSNRKLFSFQLASFKLPC